jgi:DNA-binding MarR family transcriptional regulator
MPRSRRAVPPLDHAPERGPIDRIEGALADLFELATSARLRHRRPGASGLPISAPGHRLLHWLTGHGPASVTRLAEAAELTVPTASRQLHQLESLGCVERRADPDDGRVVVYAATPVGRRAQDRFRGVIRDEVEASLARWTVDDRARLAELLERMMHDFRVGATTGSPLSTDLAGPGRPTGARRAAGTQRIAS